MFKHSKLTNNLELIQINRIISLHCVLIGAFKWSHAIRKVYRLTIFLSRILSNLFGKGTRLEKIA